MKHGINILPSVQQILIIVNFNVIAFNTVEGNENNIACDRELLSSSPIWKFILVTTCMCRSKIQISSIRIFNQYNSGLKLINHLHIVPSTYSRLRLVIIKFNN